MRTISSAAAAEGIGAALAAPLIDELARAIIELSAAPSSHRGRLDVGEAAPSTRSAG